MQRDTRLLRVHVSDLLDQLVKILLNELIADLLGKGKMERINEMLQKFRAQENQV